MAQGCQVLVLPLPWDAHRSASDREVEAGGWECPDVGAARGLWCGPSETYPADTPVRASGCRRTLKLPQITGFRPAGDLGGLPSFGRVSSISSGDRAKPSRSLQPFSGEGATSRSLQAFSGRSVRMQGRVPGASNGSASPRFGGAGLQRPNQSSVCQSREQRQTGPRTPLTENEGRPRARNDKKERIKCSQVEYDSC